MKKVISCLLTLTLLFNFTNLIYAENKFEVHFVQVGVGSSTLIKRNHDYIDNDINTLIDGGLDKNKITEYLQKIKLKYLDNIVVTNFEKSSFGGLERVFKEIKLNFDIPTLPKFYNIEPSEEYNLFVENILKYMNTSVVAGMGLSLKNFGFEGVSKPVGTGFSSVSVGYEVMAGSKGMFNVICIEDNVVVLLNNLSEELQSKINFDFLKEKKNIILEVSNWNDKANIKKEILEKINPSHVIISNIQKNINTDMLKLLEDKKIKVLQTNKNGNIILNMDEKGFNFTMDYK
jgi:beta-lactamase superfamily II metal-dependent hydrolase